MIVSTCANLRGKLRRKESRYSRGCSIYASGEDSDEIGEAHAEGRIFETKTGEVVDGSNTANTAAEDASGDADFFLERPVINLHRNQKDDNHASMLLARQGKTLGYGTWRTDKIERWQRSRGMRHNSG